MSPHHNATKRRSQYDAAWRHALGAQGIQGPSRCPMIPMIMSRLESLGVSVPAFLAELLRPTADEDAYYSERRNNQRWRESMLEKLLSHCVNAAQREFINTVLRAHRGPTQAMTPMPTREISSGEMAKRKRQRWAALLERFPFASVPKELLKETSLAVWRDWKNGRSVPPLADVGIVCNALGIHHLDAWCVFDPESYGSVSSESEQRSRRRTHTKFLSGWPDAVRLEKMNKDAIQARRLETRAFREIQARKFCSELRAAETQKALDAARIGEQSHGAASMSPVVDIPVVEMVAPFSIDDLLNELVSQADTP